LTLTGVAVVLVLLAPQSNAASGPQDNGIFSGTPAAGEPDAPVLQPEFQDTVVFSSLSNPTNVEFAPDGKIFVAEKRGVVKVFDNLSDTTPTTVADLNVNVYNFWDRGLLGLAVAPGFPTDQSIYVLYTYDADIGGTAPKYGTPGVYSDPCPDGATGAGCRVSGRLSRINASTGAETVLITDWCQQFPSHSIGDLAFGADGKLYVSGGEGASFNVVDYGNLGGNLCTDPANEGGAIRSQDLRTPFPSDPTTLDGTILRLEPATGLAASGNPLIGSSDLNERRIIAHGLRNPFRFTIKPGTNEVWLGDVGWGNWEEINRITDPLGTGLSAVENFGWPCYEGAFPASARQSGYDGANIPICEGLYTPGDGNVVAPYYAYNHASKIVTTENCPSGGSSISGLAFYQGGNYPDSYDGALFFADYTRGCIWVIFAGQNGLPDPNDRRIFLDRSSPDPAVPKDVGPTDLDIGPGGDLFYPDFDNGTIRRIQFVGQPGGTLYLSDLTWTSMTNGWGPVEKDRSNGGLAAGDGRTLTLNGTTYAKGLGAHAVSDIRYALAGCTRFKAEVGVDDEVGTKGSVVFQVYADATQVYDSGLMTGTTATKTIDVSISGASQLRLAVTDGATFGIDSDHADWALARIECGTSPPDTEPPTAPSGLGATPVSQSRIDLSWTASQDNVGVTGYHLERCQGGSCMNFSEIATPSGTTYSDTGLAAGATYRYRVRANDAAQNLSGYSNIVTATTVGAPNTPPTVTMSKPVASTLWSVGEAIPYEGSATDTEDGGALPPSALAWTLVVQHCWQYDPQNCHSHTIQQWTGTSGTFIAPDHEYPAHLVLTLTATDSGGLSSSTTVSLNPRTVTLTFQSSPSGLQLTVGSSSSTAPFTRTVIQGSINSVSAPSPQTLGGTVYAFQSWSDGGGASHNIVAPTTATTYTATYQVAPDTTPPTAPTNLNADAVSSSQINLSWTAATDNVGVTQYRIERCEGNGNCTNFVQIATTSSTTYSNTGLAPRTRYRYRVRAVDAANNLGPYSNIANARTR
jgi:glucose/arabinose dehydrogenase/chitodextrinase